MKPLGPWQGRGRFPGFGSLVGPGNGRRLIREFLQALRCRYTYQPMRNPHALFGFFWGLPIPFVCLALDCWASGSTSRISATPTSG